MTLRGIVALWVAALALSTPALADDADRITQEPAATLLLPYFEVELPPKPGKPQKKRKTTVFQVANVSAAPVLAHVTVWSDLAVAVTAFDLYLTGYDIQQIDMFDVIEGRLPNAADSGDPSCAVQPDEAFVLHMRAALTGQPSDIFAGKCAAQDYGEKKPVARGYVTVDSVNQCSLLLPSDAGYFQNGGTGVANNENVLWGDWFLVDRKQKRTAGGPLAHIRADAADLLTDGPQDYTFYAGLVGGSGADNRQPLSTTMSGRYANDPGDPFFSEGTQLVVWRDPKQPTSPFDCGTVPPWYPLGQTQIVVFDDQEEPEVPSFPIPPPPAVPDPVIPFPAATQLARVGGPTFPVSFARGWFYLNLNTLIFGQVDLVNPPLAQGLVYVVMDGKKTRAMVPANPLSSAASP